MLSNEDSDVEDEKIDSTDNITSTIAGTSTTNAPDVHINISSSRDIEEKAAGADEEKVNGAIISNAKKFRQGYKTNDKDLISNVERMQMRFQRVLDKYSGFEEDIYQVPEAEFMSILSNLPLDSYGILLWLMCMDQLETERKKVLWDILQFLSMRMPTQVAMALLQHYSSQMARYSPADINDLGKALVYGSQFPLATCLVLSGFFYDRASKDLTQEKQLRKLSSEYAFRAAELLEEIENDYLAVLLLETPSFHEHQSPLDIALDNNITEFLACNKVSRISNAIWTSNDLMKVDGFINPFALSSFEVSSIHKSLLENSHTFYYSSIGYFFVEVITYLIYLCIYTYLTIKQVKIDDDIVFFDYIFWLMNIGFIIGELLEVGYDGWRAYFAKWQNSFDIIICINFCLIIFFRLLVVHFISDDDKITLGIAKENEDEITWLDIAFKVIWCTNIVILWLRLLFFMLISETIGPLIANVTNMITDIMSFLKMYFIFVGGFAVGLYFLVGGKNGNYLFRAMDVTVVSLFKTTLGSLEWECILDSFTDDNSTNSTATTRGQCDYPDPIEEIDSVRSAMAQFLLMLFTMLTLVVLFNLLTGMMATTFATISKRADIEVLSRKVSLGMEYDQSNQIMPPPFNIFVIILYVLYTILDFLLLIFLQKFMSESFGNRQWRCEECRCLNEYIYDEDPNAVYICTLCNSIQMEDINPKSRLLRHPREYQPNDKFCAIYAMGIRELLDIQGTFEKEVEIKNDTPIGLSNFSSILNKNMEREILVTGGRHLKVDTPGNNSGNATPATPSQLRSDAFSAIKNKTDHMAWICGYCRHRIPAGTMGSIGTFKQRLIDCDIPVDEDDIDTIQELHPLLCPICYRTIKVRSRMIFVMEIFSYYIFLFVFYPIIRICLIPVYVYMFYGILVRDSKLKDDEEFEGAKKKSNKKDLAKKRIEKLLPTDVTTRNILKTNNKVWKILSAWKKRREKINSKEDTRIAAELQEQQKEIRKDEQEVLAKQRGLVIARLSDMVDIYYRTRVDQSEQAKLRTDLARKRTTMNTE